MTLTPKKAREIVEELGMKPWANCTLREQIDYEEAHGFLDGVKWQEERAKVLAKFIEHFINQEDHTFAECSVAEDLWDRAKEALKSYTESLKEE